MKEQNHCRTKFISAAIRFPPALRVQKESSSVHQLRQVSAVEEYRADLARKPLEAHSHVDDEDGLEDEWRRVTESILSAIEASCPANLTRLNEHWIASRSADLIAARKAIASTSDYDGARRSLKHRIIRSLKNDRTLVDFEEMAQSHNRASNLSLSMRSYPISEQTEYAFDSRAWLHTPHSRFPVIGNVASGTEVTLLFSKDLVRPHSWRHADEGGEIARSRSEPLLSECAGVKLISIQFYATMGTPEVPWIVSESIGRQNMEGTYMRFVVMYWKTVVWGPVPAGINLSRLHRPYSLVVRAKAASGSRAQSLWVDMTGKWGIYLNKCGGVKSADESITEERRIVTRNMYRSSVSDGAFSLSERGQSRKISDCRWDALDVINQSLVDVSGRAKEIEDPWIFLREVFDAGQQRQTRGKKWDATNTVRSAVSIPPVYGLSVVHRSHLTICYGFNNAASKSSLAEHKELKFIQGSRLPQATHLLHGAIYEQECNIAMTQVRTEAFKLLETSFYGNGCPHRLLISLYKANLSDSYGLLAEGTKSQICEAITGILTKKNISRAYAHEISAHHINCCIPQPQQVNQLEDLPQLFTVLRQHDIRVAVCTSDSREPTIRALDKLRLLHLVNLVICGDDEQTHPKPDPHNGLLICDRLSVKPNEVVMVGDTPTDVKFAKNSRFGLTLGVLSGVGRRSDLERAWYGSKKTELNVRQLQNSKFQIIPSVADIIPIVLPNASVPVRVRPRLLSASQYDPTKKYKLVILDKNGSLTDVHPRWSNWAEVISSRLRKITSARIADKFMEMIGYDAEARRVSGGMLPDCSILHIRDCLGYLLNLNGYDERCSSEIVNKVWFVPDLDADDLLPGVVETITHLRQHGLAIALNTSDSQEVSRKFLSCTGLEGKIDYVLSAEDAGRHAKTSPDAVYHVLNALGHQPDETIVVGDTPSDLISGQSAGVGLTVGVLSGFSRAHNLLPYANWLIPNITHLPRLVLSNQH
ncbi:pyrophosphatase ppaX [Clonorchis sinensis]|uniref:Pyrophosphatase ppaX n=1 Tax=Clonorchis sinensis TaxID=79923 RepID=G7Y2T5_CLOSI|nr:pyrophosphatase ppaX [Clonorchis sinensis]